MATRDSTVMTELKSWHDFVVPRAFKAFMSIGVITPDDKLDVLISGLLEWSPPALGKGTKEKERDEEEVEWKE
ncbi:hypothetical protein BHE74_00041387 [Ensete ventricosum]|nr:hypothetical protein BHE74_00041387 [Ensete ventricosum]